MSSVDPHRLTVEMLAVRLRMIAADTSRPAVLRAEAARGTDGLEPASLHGADVEAALRARIAARGAQPGTPDDIAEVQARIAAARPARPALTIDPGIRFGAPHVGGISAEAIACIVMGGTSVDETAADYGLSRHEVLLACWWEGTSGAYRREWGEWAGLVHPGLAASTPDVDGLPDPPDRRDLDTDHVR